MLLHLLGLTLASCLLVFQSFTIVGGVRDSRGQAVTGVRLSVMDENFQPIRTIFVDSSGRFTVRGLSSGRYTFKIETTGTPYEEQSQQLELQSLRVLGSGSETVPLDFTLKFKKSNDTTTRSGSLFAQNVPGSARSEYENALKNLKSNKSEKLVASLKNAVAIFPDYFDALELLGTEYVKSGQYEAALPVLTHALEVNSRAPKSLYALGVAYLKLNQLAEALPRLEKAAELDASSPNIQMMLGLAYGNSGEFTKSEAAFKRALQLGGAAAAEAHFYLAGIYNKQGRYPEARASLEAYLKESKNIKDPVQLKAMIEKLKERAKTVPPSPALSAPAAAEPPPRSAGPGLADKAPHASPPASAANSAKPLAPLPPEYANLLKQSEAEGQVIYRKLLDYTYQLKKTRHVLNKRGNSVYAEERVYEAYPVRGEHVLILLSRDGIPSRRVAEDRKQAVKRLEVAEQERLSGQHSKDETGSYISAGVSGIYDGKPGYVSISLAALLRYCEFFSPEVEEVEGRQTVRFKFRQPSSAQLPSSYSYLAKLAGSIWIDQADRAVTRVEAWPAAEAAFDLVQSTSPPEEAALIYRQSRQADGLWLPKLIRLNAGGRMDLFEGLNWDVTFEFSAFQRFHTNASEELIKPPSN